MKPVIFITTFSKEGYESYGKTWIDVFTSYTKDSIALIYTDFELVTDNARIKGIDFDSNIPYHSVWANEFYNADTISKNGYKQLGIKFSHKAFVMLDVLEKYSNEYVIWLDGDCEFKDFADFNEFVPKLLNNTFMACQIEKDIAVWRKEEHIESGIILFDTMHADKLKFVNELKRLYSIDYIKTLEKPYDGFLIKRALDNIKIQYVDLFPEGYIPSESSAHTTFIHPEIYCRFNHNIYTTIKKPFFEYRPL